MNDTGLASALDGFAKAFYSSLLLDLGSASPLTDRNSITYLLSKRNDSVLGVKNTEAVDTLGDGMAPLNFTAAQLSLQYVCSVPRQRQILDGGINNHRRYCAIISFLEVPELGGHKSVLARRLKTGITALVVDRTAKIGSSGLVRRRMKNC
jgi:hypothetical protein